VLLALVRELRGQNVALAYAPPVEVQLLVHQRKTVAWADIEREVDVPLEDLRQRQRELTREARTLPCDEE
jgi:hypothetical protein